VEVAKESVILPKIQPEWIRLALHDIRLELPPQAGQAIGAKDFHGLSICVPGFLLSNVSDFGELFQALAALPQPLHGPCRYKTIVQIGVTALPRLILQQRWHLHQRCGPV